MRALFEERLVMIDSPLGTDRFEELKKLNEHGAEYWSARELQPHLGYSQ